MEPVIEGDLRLVDCEDADVAEISASAPLLARYQKTLHAFIGGAQDFCRKRGIAYSLARNEVPVDQTVSKYLRKQGLVR